MVRPATYRDKKYQGKLDPDVQRQRFNVLKPIMKDQQDNYQRIREQYEIKVRKICAKNDIPTIYVHQAEIFCMIIWSLTQKFTGSELENEARLQYELWKKRFPATANFDNMLKDILKLFEISI